MSKVAEAFMEDVEKILNDEGGVTSLDKIVNILNWKWSLSVDEKSASMLESLGFGVSYIKDRYMVSL